MENLDRLIFLLALGLVAFGCVGGAAEQETVPHAAPDTASGTAAALPSVGETPVEEALTVELAFVNHPQAGMPEQDVFIARQGYPARWVERVDADRANDRSVLAMETYTTLNPTPHDPFKLTATPLGPFAKGSALGFTMGEWLEATGAGTYTVYEDRAELDLSFAHLVPNGLYTVWCSQITFPPTFVVVDKPCGAADGSQNIFTADADGNGRWKREIAPLPESTAETVSAVALAYHSDGRVYGASPGPFGQKTHVQIFAMLPQPTAG